MDEFIKRNFNDWLLNCKDEELLSELKSMEGNKKSINEAFYKDLEFGTGGLRGIMGAGSNRLNIYTVRKASLGLSKYINKNFKSPSVVISYDSRHNSKLFAETAAEVFASFGIYVYFFRELCPTPMLSFAVRRYKASFGVMITASHNPSEYNGYKVYNEEGCQITDNAAKEIYSFIKDTETFNDSFNLFNDLVSNGDIEYVCDDIFKIFENEVLNQSVLKYLSPLEYDKDVKIIYTPLNGTGLRAVTETLDMAGFKNILVPKEQRDPNGDFPTCKKPNPEEIEALSLGISYLNKEEGDILIATDPDCDRAGIAVRDNGNITLLSGNELGIVLLNFLIEVLTKTKRMPKDPIIMKSIVSTDLADKIALENNIKCINLLTGFKYIGEKICDLERKDMEDRFILGFEESYGYLRGSYVRDKDGVCAALLIAEMLSYYKKRKMSLIDVLSSIYQKYGYRINTLDSIKLLGASGRKLKDDILRLLREELSNGEFSLSINKNHKITAIGYKDYLYGDYGLPKSDVLKIDLLGGNSLIIRPSGTEPKLKIYISAAGKNRDECIKTKEMIFRAFNKKIGL